MSISSRRQFTVGMAVFNDFNGIYFTTQALLAFHKEHVGEIVVVDNNPDPRVQRYCGTIGAKYVPFPEPKGTAAPRDEIFRHAQFDRVLVVDSHVILEPGAMDYLDDHVISDDLYHGPLIYDWGDVCATHMDDVWRGEMWGIWGRAYTGQGVPPFSLVDGRPIDLKTGQPIKLPTNDLSQYHLPTEPFEIPAHGMGLWACRRDSWLGFNPGFREFGGEEWYIHEKYRRAGRTVWCLPGVRWRHRFSDLTSHKVEYPLSRFAKVKNYVLGHQELGLPLDRIKAEFVKPGKLTEDQWAMACGCNGSKPKSPVPLMVGVPQEFIDLATGRVVDFTGTEWAKATEVIRPTQSPGQSELHDGDILCLGTAAYGLGRWCDRAPVILVQSESSQIAPFLLARQHYTLVRSSGNWHWLSSRSEDKKTLPGVGTTITNGLLALGRAAKGAMQTKGLPMVTEATHESRLRTCAICPHRVDNRCGLCSCYVEAKTWVATEECPERRWLRTV